MNNKAGKTIECGNVRGAVILYKVFRKDLSRELKEAKEKALQISGERTL